MPYSKENVDAWLIGIHCEIPQHCITVDHLGYDSENEEECAAKTPSQSYGDLIRLNGEPFLPVLSSPYQVEQRS